MTLILGRPINLSKSAINLVCFSLNSIFLNRPVHANQTVFCSFLVVFKYSGLHSVVELGSEAAYKSCDLGTPVNSLSSGNDVVKLSKTGTRYFACGTPGHCQSGMKVKVNVVSADSTAVPSPGSDSSSDSDSGSSTGSDSGSSTGSGSRSSSGQGLRAFIGYILAVGSLVIGLVWAF